MPDKPPVAAIMTVPTNRLAAGYMFFMAFAHIAVAALGIYALMVLAGDALPGWQVAILERSMFFVPLFVLFEQIMLAAAGAYPKTALGVLGHAIPLSATAVLSYVQSDGSWNRVWFDLAMPMLGVTGLIWVALGIAWPAREFISKPSLGTAGMAAGFFAAYAIFIVPSVGVLVSMFSYAAHGLFSGNATFGSVLLVLSMAGIILAEAFRYATIFGSSRGYLSSFR